jgi:hypothetical protein
VLSLFFRSLSLLLFAAGFADLIAEQLVEMKMLDKKKLDEFLCDNT